MHQQWEQPNPNFFCPYLVYILPAALCTILNIVLGLHSVNLPLWIVSLVRLFIDATVQQIFWMYLL